MTIRRISLRLAGRAVRPAAPPAYGGHGLLSVSVSRRISRRIPRQVLVRTSSPSSASCSRAPALHSHASSNSHGTEISAEIFADTDARMCAFYVHVQPRTEINTNEMNIRGEHIRQVQPADRPWAQVCQPQLDVGPNGLRDHRALRIPDKVRALLWRWVVRCDRPSCWCACPSSCCRTGATIRWSKWITLIRRSVSSRLL